MHGGAKGSDAPIGNQNAFKHGHYTKQAIEERKKLRQLIREAERLIEEIDP
jgi:glucans biosynthesis protein